MRLTQIDDIFCMILFLVSFHHFQSVVRNPNQKTFPQSLTSSHKKSCKSLNVLRIDCFLAVVASCETY